MKSWKYIKHNVSEDEITAFEEMAGFMLSEESKSIILNFNNGRPVINQFDTLTSQGVVFEKLLSFNKNDSENVFKTHKALNRQVPENLVAIALEPSGDYLCLDKEQKVFLWRHESERLEGTGKNLAEVIDSLY